MSIRGILLHFSDSSGELAQALHDNVELGEEDLLFIENHLLMVQMACTEWNRKNSSPVGRSSQGAESPKPDERHSAQ